MLLRKSAAVNFPQAIDRASCRFQIDLLHGAALVIAVDAKDDMPAESGVENARQASRLAARVIAHGGFELFSQSRHGFEAFDQIVFVCRDGHDLYNIGLSLLQKQGKLDDLFSFHGNAGMAAMTPYSTVWFRKVFREVTGMSPIRYIRTAKMNKAKDMLESESSSVTDIAYAPGYNDVYEFSRDFKKKSAFRRRGIKTGDERAHTSRKFFSTVSVDARITPKASYVERFTAFSSLSMSAMTFHCNYRNR